MIIKLITLIAALAGGGDIFSTITDTNDPGHRTHAGTKQSSPAYDAEARRSYLGVNRAWWGLHPDATPYQILWYDECLGEGGVLEPPLPDTLVRYPGSAVTVDADGTLLVVFFGRHKDLPACLYRIDQHTGDIIETIECPILIPTTPEQEGDGPPGTLNGSTTFTFVGSELLYRYGWATGSTVKAIGQDGEHRAIVDSAQLGAAYYSVEQFWVRETDHGWSMSGVFIETPDDPILPQRWGGHFYLESTDGQVWTGPDGAALATPVTYANAPIALNHLTDPTAGSASWFHRDVGHRWIISSRGDAHAGGWRPVFVRYDAEDGWTEYTLPPQKADTDAVAVGEAGTRMIILHSREDEPGALFMRISDDGGETWGPEQLVADHGPDTTIAWIQNIEGPRFFYGHTRTSFSVGGIRYRTAVEAYIPDGWSW